MPRKDRYLEQLQRRKEVVSAAETTPTSKPVEQMTDDELSRELEGVRTAECRLSEEAVRLSRAGASDGYAPALDSRLWFPRRSKRRPWK